MRVPKTNKLFINGAFPRTESGRSFPFSAADGSVYANLCDGTRKDLRAAVDAARAALEGWAGRSSYSRAQILYRMAELVSARHLELEDCLRACWGLKESEAVREAAAAADAFVYYAGFADKFQQLASSVNPVSGPHHNFTTAEPVGVVGFAPGPRGGFAAFAAQLAAILTPGNTLVALMPGRLAPLLAPFAEILATSDLPPGAANLLTESSGELFRQLASHMEVQAVCVEGDSARAEARKLGVDNMKRVLALRAEGEQLACVLDFVEYKTVWHPVGF
jgi:acyl-CoA reductase-like NAD-dependent aldehyde dehydrogenase